MAGVDPVSLAIAGLTTMSSMQQARAQAKAQTSADNARRQQILARRQVEERREAEALRKSVAARRARFAAGGISGAGGGSADAVLRGLRATSLRNLADNRQLDGATLGALGGTSLFDDRLGLAASLIDSLQPRTPQVSLFDNRIRTVRTPTATI